MCADNGFPSSRVAHSGAIGPRLATAAQLRNERRDKEAGRNGGGLEIESDDILVTHVVIQGNALVSNWCGWGGENGALGELRRVDQEKCSGLRPVHLNRLGNLAQCLWSFIRTRGGRMMAPLFTSYAP